MSAAPKPPSLAGVIFTGLGYAPGAIVAFGFLARALYRRRRIEAAINAVVALSPLALIAWYPILSTPVQYPASVAPLPAAPAAPASSGPRGVPNATPAPR